MPADRGGPAAWREGNKPVQQWLRWIRDQVRAGKIKVDGDRLQYTWSLERQAKETQSPHWHILSNVSHADWAEMTREWQRILGVSYANTDYREVKDERQLEDYICKYVSKTVLPPDLLAIMYRKRTFASTVKAEEKPLAGWKREEQVQHDKAQEQTECPGSYQPEKGWRVVWAMPGKGARWERESNDSATAENLIARDAWQVLDLYLTAKAGASEQCT
jgi:hypothetical protein